MTHLDQFQTVAELGIGSLRSEVIDRCQDSYRVCDHEYVMEHDWIVAPGGVGWDDYVIAFETDGEVSSSACRSESSAG